MTPTRQWPIVLALVALLLGAMFVGNRDHEPPASAPALDDAAAVATAGTRSSAWFCPGVPASVPADRETISIANTGEKAARVDLTIWPDDGSAPVVQTLDVGPSAVSTTARTALGVPGGLVVETFSPSVVVESGIEAADQLAVNACASVTARAWYFSAGTTVRGAEQWLMLFNPHGTDAKVDITVSTDEGRKAPTGLQGLDVGRHSRVAVKVNDHVQNQARVGIELRTRVGRVVAEQTTVRADTSGATGTMRSLGVVAPAASWVFPFAQNVPNSQTLVALSNPGNRDAEVDVQVVSTNADVVIPPYTATVGADRVVFVQVGGCAGTPDEVCVPIDVPDLTSSVQVTTDDDHPVVAEQIVSRADVNAESGVSTTAGAALAADRWVFARSRVADEHATILSLVNSGPTEVQASVALVHDGVVEELPELQGVTVAPSRPTVVTLSDLSPTDAAVVVTATGPIAVQRSLFGAAEQSTALGIPDRSR
jgi:hypothetical protein